MKKSIISLLILASLGLGMTSGAKTFGGSGNITQSLAEGADMTVMVDANMGYFAADNMEALFGLGLNGTTDTMFDAMTFHVGGNYYMGNMYAGATYKGSTEEGSDGGLDITGGYLMGCGDGIYLNLFGTYQHSLAEGADGTLMFGFGVKTFF